MYNLLYKNYYGFISMYLQTKEFLKYIQRKVFIYILFTQIVYT